MSVVRAETAAVPITIHDNRVNRHGNYVQNSQSVVAATSGLGLCQPSSQHATICVSQQSPTTRQL